jgi:hypothetical protein
MRGCIAGLSAFGYDEFMSLKQSSRTFVAWIVLLALGFTQMALAAEPCMQPVMTAADAFVTAAQDDCHHPDVASANLCLKQCTGGDRVSFSTLAVVAPPPMMPVLMLPLSTDGARSRGMAMARVDIIVDPPIPIRFCSFLI